MSTKISFLHHCHSTVSFVPDRENLALNKPALQSSVYKLGFAKKAVDGNMDTNYLHHSCSHTLRQRGAWWVVDLQSEYVIDEVVITNRGDCCGKF